MTAAQYAVQAGQFWLVLQGDKYAWRRGNVGRSNAVLFDSTKDAQAAMAQMKSGRGGSAPKVVPAPGKPAKKVRADHFIIRRGIGRTRWYEWIAEDDEGYFWTDNNTRAKAFPTKEAAEAANKSLPRPERGDVSKVKRYK